MNSQHYEPQLQLIKVLERDVRIASLVIGIQLLGSGCAAHQSPPTLQHDIPFATLEIPLVRQTFGFFGTSAVVTKDAVWVVVPGEEHIYKIDPLQKKVVASIPVGAKLNANFFYLHSPLVESGNCVWVAAENSIIRIDSKTGEVIARIPISSQEPFILSGSDSAVWVGTMGSYWSWVRYYTVSKIDPQTNRVIVTLPQQFSIRSARVTAGTDALWLLDGWADTLSRIDPTSGQVVTAIALGRLSYPHLPASVGEGTVWVGNAREGTIVRINPETNQVTATIPLPYPAGGRPDEFFGPPRYADGAVWVASGYSGFVIGPTVVYGIDTSTNQVVATLNARTYIGGGFAVGHSALWVPTIVDAGYKKRRLVLEVYRLPTWKMSKDH